MGIAAAIVVALLRGGNLRNLGNVHVRWAWLALVALAIQVVLLRLRPDWDTAARVFFPLTHLAILAVAWVNRDLGGMRLVAAAVALNLIVMTANGGFMPVAPAVLVEAGLADSAESVPMYGRVGHSKSLVMPRDETTLWWLSDVVALRRIRTIVSIGDILMVPGIFLFVEKAMLQQEDW